jgi:cyclopropane fatty-acyl-phospholipid synthase-like methyltransferase
MNKETIGFYSNSYNKEDGTILKWSAGSANPEIVSLVYKGVIKEKSKILEVGCGLGAESVFLAARGMNVTAMDLSEDAIEKCKRISEVYGLNINWMVHDLLGEELFDEEFDIITDQGCFHHMHEDEREIYADRVYKYLKPGGMLILRAFSDKIPGGPQPRRVSSDNLIDTLNSKFKLEHLERILSFSTDMYDKPLSWFSIWYKRGK